MDVRAPLMVTLNCVTISQLTTAFATKLEALYFAARWRHGMGFLWCIIPATNRSNGGYETPRNSACVHLSFHRTLRDYTVQASTRFSNEVDQMLTTVAWVDTCPDREKCIILLLDEMHIGEDLIFDKHTGNMIGFSNLGDINRHLLQFEKSVLEDKLVHHSLPGVWWCSWFVDYSTVCSFCTYDSRVELSGVLLYNPFCEAVKRVENCGLKVS